jgi:hypothetical protein
MRDNLSQLLDKGRVSFLDGDKHLLKNIFSKRASFFAFIAITAIAWLGSAQSASAQTFGNLLCRAFDNATSFGPLFVQIAYAAGALFGLRAVYHLRAHAEDPRNNKLTTPLMYLFGSACLMSLPGVVETLERSLGYTVTEGGVGSCAAISVSSSTGGAATDVGLDGMLVNFIANIKGPMQDVISITAILCGLFMILHGLMKAAKYGTDPKANSIHSILTNLGFGAALMTIGDNMNLMVDTLFGGDTAEKGMGISQGTVMAWKAVSDLGSDQFAAAIAAALTFIQIIGAIAFVRGWLIMKKVVEGGGNVSLAQGLTHILGGVLAINIGGFLPLMDMTMGTGLMN